MKKKLAGLRDRVANNAVVQERQKPHEDPNQLIKEATGILEEMQKLIVRINAANMKHKLSDGRSLAEAIARRDKLIQQHSLLQAAVQGARKEPDRYSMKEIKWVATVDVAKLQKQSDDLSKSVRELNVLIQAANWKVELD